MFMHATQLRKHHYVAERRRSERCACRKQHVLVTKECVLIFFNMYLKPIVACVCVCDLERAVVEDF